METKVKLTWEQVKEQLPKTTSLYYVDYREELSKETLQKVLEAGTLETIDDLIMEWDNWEAVSYYIDELKKDIEIAFDLEEDQAEEIMEQYEDKIRDEIYDRDDSTPIDDLLRNTGDLTCLIYLYSNYDCTNSMDTMETSEYLSQVYSRVKAGVRKADYMYEHVNGAYGGSLFCFAFKAGVDEILQMKKDLENEDTILIPKGTQFGYFSSFQGAGSLFDKVTYRNFKLNTKETGGDFHPDYDCIGLTADIEQSYSMDDVYGGSEFIN